MSDLSKKALEVKMNKAQNANKIQIQGVPENKHEDLKEIVKQIIYDTGVKIHPLEIDQVYRDGYYN